MPHRQIPSTRKASLLRNTEPTLCRLRTSSNTTTSGNFSASLNSSALMRFISNILSFFILGAKIVQGKRNTKRIRILFYC